MENENAINAIKELSNECQKFKSLGINGRPAKGWLNHIRNTLNVPVKYLADRVGISDQGILSFEKSELNKTITLESLEKVAAALDLKLVYGFAPKDETLYQKVEKKIRTQISEDLEGLPSKVKYPLMNHVKREKLVQEMFENPPKTMWKT